MDRQEMQERIATNGHLEIVKFLIENGANIEGIEGYDYPWYDFLIRGFFGILLWAPIYLMIFMLASSNPTAFMLGYCCFR